MKKQHASLCTFAAAALLSACQSAPVKPAEPPTSPEVVGEFRKGSGYLNGYLDRKALPDSLALVPPPPAPGSARHAADLEAHRQTRAWRDTPRWTVATKDVNLKFPEAAGVFSCALDIPISQEATPHLNMLLRRTLIDAGLATYKAKDHYARKRPFAQLSETTCSPKEEAHLAKDGSYPSGHAALGWAWGLVLTGVAPDKADALLQRAHAFGDSRMVCGVHWQSDLEAGRVVGAATVARLQSDPVFQAQAQRAKAEIDAARAKGLKSDRADCAAEAAAIQR
ncbi:MAG: phosphatase PAP2 family protein [Limnohabitans sp.]|nr:phosphatase PAP2 family protein [Limnohabitans sp.]